MRYILYFLLLWFTNQSLQAQNEAPVFNLRGHIHPINTVAFSADSKYLLSASGSQANTLQPSQCIMWGLENGQKIAELTQHPQEIRAVAFGKNDDYFITAGGYQAPQNFKMWNKNTGKEINNIIAHQAINSIALSQDKEILVTGGLDKTVKIWGLHTQEIRKTLTGHSEIISEVAISPDQKWIGSAAANTQAKKGEIKIWDLEGALIYTLGWDTGGQSDAVHSIDFSPDNRYLVSGGEDGALKIWDLSTGKVWKNLTEPYTNITKVRFSPNGDFIATASKDQTIKLWNVNTGQKIMTYRSHFKAIQALAFSPDGRWIASGGEDQIIKIWEAPSYAYIAQAQVQQKMKEWYQRGKFEKSEDYQARINNETLKNDKIQGLYKEISQQIAEEKIGFQYTNAHRDKTYNIKIKKNHYDADNEVFKIEIAQVEPIYLKMPIQKAKGFDACMASLKFNECIFNISPQGKLVMQFASIHCPLDNQYYRYEIQTLPFTLQQPVEIDLISQISEPKQEVQKIEKQQENNIITSGGISEIDYQLPKTRMKQPDAIAVVIGNAQYQKTKNVDFAINDARSIRNYLIDVMGYSKENIIYLENASYADFKMIFGSKENPKGKLHNLIKPDKSDVFVYYSGHGAPGLNDKAAYFVPVECDPQYVELTGFAADIFYNNLAKLPAKSVVVTLDACFSGENIYKNISPIVIKSKGALGLKAGALLASSAADQVSAWYPEKKHGIFTYFFLKAIHNQNADFNKDKQLTLAEIFQYINDESEGIPYYARRLHGIIQTPVLKGQNPEKVIVDYR